MTHRLNSHTYFCNRAARPMCTGENGGSDSVHIHGPHSRLQYPPGGVEVGCLTSSSLHPLIPCNIDHGNDGCRAAVCGVALFLGVPLGRSKAKNLWKRCLRAPVDFLIRCRHLTDLASATSKQHIHWRINYRNNRVILFSTIMNSARQFSAI